MATGMGVALAPHEEKAEGIDVIEGEVIAGDDAELGSSAQRLGDSFSQELEARLGDEGGDDVDRVRGREETPVVITSRCERRLAFV